MAFTAFPLIAGLSLLGLVFGILTAVDASKYPEWAFIQTGSSKAVWQIVPIVLGLFCFGVGGIVMYVMWVSSRRDAVARAAHAAGPPPFYGTPPPYGYGPPPQPGWGPPSGPAGWNPPPPPAPPPPSPQPPPAPPQ